MTDIQKINLASGYEKEIIEYDDMMRNKYKLQRIKF
jgi:hypothetical protein